jgi:hypothetical protein
LSINGHIRRGMHGTYHEQEPRYLPHHHLSLKNQQFLHRGQGKRCHIVKTKSGQKEGMQGKDTSTYLQPRPKNLLHPQQICPGQRTNGFLSQKLINRGGIVKINIQQADYPPDGLGDFMIVMEGMDEGIKTHQLNPG